MQKFYKAANLQEAYLIRGMLSAAGIEVRIFNEHLVGGLGDLPFPEVYPELWLENETDVTRARRIMADYEGRSAPRRAVYCRSCGEENPGGFEICWHCGKAL